MKRPAHHRPLIVIAMLIWAMLGAVPGHAAPLLSKYLADVTPAQIAPGADAFGPIRDDIPSAPILKDGQVIGHAILTSDFVTTTGYSGKPIHVVMGVDADAKVTGVRLVKHSEPIVLIGIPDKRIHAVTEKYTGLDLIAEAAAGGSAHDLDIVSGATVTIMVIDDSIVRAGLKAARALGLGGLKPDAHAAGPRRVLLAPADPPVSDWRLLDGDGSVRAMLIDVGQVNEAFEGAGDPRALKRPEKGDPSALYIDMRVALVSAPEIGRSLLGDAEYANLTSWLAPGEHAILVMGRGRYSFKGSGYVRGGIFDRIQLIQGDVSARFFDKQHRRLGELAAAGAPSFDELDLFRIPADIDFDPAEPFRLQLLLQRPVGAIDKAFVTADLGYRLPDRFLEAPVLAPAPAALEASDAQALTHLWKRIWTDKAPEAAILGIMLVALTGAFFFQMQLTRSEKHTRWFRIGFLCMTLFFLGWHANAQLSVVNILAFFSAAMSGFQWSAFLMDPLVFILWFAVAASLLFWGRGAYCGWLCPFGALQELSNKLARLAKVPQILVPWGLHERLWPIKYMIFLGLFAMSLYSLEMAERYAEIEPFKTAIILKFQRGWPFVLFAVLVLLPGLFIERFYCRYMCPLGAALAIPARLRMFDWLRRYRDCGSPCQRCANDCMVQAIHPEGHINPNECHQCLGCQVLYQSHQNCPVVKLKDAKRAKAERLSSGSPAQMAARRAAAATSDIPQLKP